MPRPSCRRGAAYAAPVRRPFGGGPVAAAPSSCFRLSSTFAVAPRVRVATLVALNVAQSRRRSTTSWRRSRAPAAAAAAARASTAVARGRRRSFGRSHGFCFASASRAGAGAATGAACAAAGGRATQL